MSSNLVQYIVLFSLANSGIVLSIPPASQQQQQQQAQAQAISNANTQSVNHEQVGLKSPEPVTGPVHGPYHGYNRANVPLNQGNAYPSYGGYTQQDGSVTYGRSPSQQIFGIASNGDFSLSAYFGPIFWGCLSGVIVVVLLFWLANAVGGLNFFSGLLAGAGEEKSGKKGGKAIDMDKLSAMVYTAIDHYGKWKNNNYDKHV